MEVNLSLVLRNESWKSHLSRVKSSLQTNNPQTKQQISYIYSSTIRIATMPPPLNFTLPCNYCVYPWCYQLYYLFTMWWVKRNKQSKSGAKLKATCHQKGWQVKRMGGTEVSKRLSEDIHRNLLVWFLFVKQCKNSAPKLGSKPELSNYIFVGTRLWPVGPT